MEMYELVDLAFGTEANLSLAYSVLKQNMGI